MVARGGYFPSGFDENSPWEKFLRGTDAVRRRFFVLGSMSAFFVAACLMGMSEFMLWVEERPGAMLRDPLLEWIPVLDCTWVAFGCIYGALALSLASLIRTPLPLFRLMLAYGLLGLFRVLGMYLTPLDPPIGLIPLVDPIVQIGSAGKVLTRDLFFSGHTSGAFLFAISARGKKAQSIAIVLTVVVAACVLLQRVHYSVDVFVAPFCAYAAFRLAMMFHRHFLKIPESASRG